MSYPTKRSRYDPVGAATAQFYNSTGTVLSNLKLPTDISYLISSHPTNTIVIADLPPGCGEHDLSSLFNRYGPVKNVRMVCNREAALVEFCEISSPTRLVHMAKINPFCIGHNRVRLEFSSETIHASAVQKNDQILPGTDGEITRIVHLDVAAADYPITVDVIKAIAQPHGKILRLFIGKKNVDRSLEVLVEFETIEQATAAKEQLDGADIYSGCCSLTASFSKLQKVHVTKNDSESWDFTGPNANVEGPLTTNSTQRPLLGPVTPANQSASTMVNPILSAPPVTPQPPSAYLPAANTIPPVMSAYSIQQAPSYYPMQSYCPAPPPSMYSVPPTPYGNASHYSAYYNPPVSTPAVSVVRSTAQTYSPKVITQITILPTPTPIHQVTPSGIGVGHATSNSSTIPMPTGQPDLSLFESVEGVVLMACNLPPTLNCDHLFNLLCLYGNIARIKFLKTRRGCAMVQVGNAETADFIHRYYNGVSIFGYAIQIYHSKQRELTEHENLGTLDDGSPVMKNYMMDPNNRFRNAVVAAKSRILEPSRTLHFFNAPLNLTPEDVCRVFTDAGASCPPRVVLFNTREGQKTSLGLSEWDTLSESLEALTLANQRPIHIAGVAHPFHLKLAFSPKPISTDRAGPSLIRYPAPPMQATRAGSNGVNCNQAESEYSNPAPPSTIDEEEEEEEAEAAEFLNGDSNEPNTVACSHSTAVTSDKFDAESDAHQAGHKSPHTPEEDGAGDSLPSGY